MDTLISTKLYPSEYKEDISKNTRGEDAVMVWGRFYQSAVPVNHLKVAGNETTNGNGAYAAPSKETRIITRCEMTIRGEAQTKTCANESVGQYWDNLKRRFSAAWADFEGQVKAKELKNGLQETEKEIIPEVKENSTEYSEIEALREQYNSLKDKRSSEGKRLREKIADIEIGDGKKD